jgi:YD repeat-containing protein
MGIASMPGVPCSRKGWHALLAGLTLLLLGLCLALPPGVQATALTTSSVSFSNLSIVPQSGSVTVLDTWTVQALTQGQNSLGASDARFDQQVSPGTATAGAMVTYATSYGQASALHTTPDLTVTGLASSTVNIPGSNVTEAFATGRGTLVNTFMITGGTGAVTVQFGANMLVNLHVRTDASGLQADTEITFHLDVNGDPQLFSTAALSIGRSDEAWLSVSPSLTSALTLAYNTPYFLVLEVDSESHGRNDVAVPEPSATLLLVLGGGLGLLLTTWVQHCRVQVPVARAVVARLGTLLLVMLALGLSAAPAQARYIGGEPPSCCKCKTGRPCPDVPGGSAISLVEGNLKDHYAVWSIQSTTGPTTIFSLAYNSYNADGSHAQVDTVLGYGWTHSYNIFLFSQLGHMFRMDSDGRVTKYKLGAGGTFTAAPGYFETPTKNPNGTFTLTQKDQTVFQFASIPNTPFLVAGPVYRLTSITDRNHNTTTLAYSNGDLTRITDTYGRSLTLTYTSQHKLATVRDPLGRTTTFTYDATGRQLRAITDPEGKTLQYSYDVQYHITQKIDKDGRRFAYLYDAHGNPVVIADGANNRLFSLSNPQNWATDSIALARDLLRVYVPTTTSKSDGRGNPWGYTYDSHGYLTTVVAPDHATTTYAYNANTLMLASVTDANGHATTFTYDPQGNLLTMTDALGHTTTFTYESRFNQMTSQTDPNGRVTIYDIDPANGNLLKETRDVFGLAVTRTWHYDGHGNVDRQEDENGNVSVHVYDAFGNRIQTTDAVGKPEERTTTYTYDAVGNLITLTDANGHTTQYAYDGLNRLTRETTPLGAPVQADTRYVYDGQSNLTQVIDRNGNATTYGYDLRQRLITLTDAQQPTPKTIAYAYDDNDNRTSITDKNRHTATFQYDVRNRLITATDAENNSSSMTYDLVGNMLSATDANGHTMFYTYDELNRLQTQTDAAGFVTHLVYDMVGTALCAQCTGPTQGSPLVTQQIDGNDKVTYFTYDGLDRLRQHISKQGDTAFAIDADDAVMTYTYDPYSNLLAVGVRTTTTMNTTTTYAYDALSRRTTATNPAGDTTGFTYDGVNNLLTITAPNGNVTTHTYDPLDRLIQVDDTVGQVAHYTYDPVGNPLTARDGNGNGTDYTYDTVYRLTDVTDALGQTTHYDYDAVGNLLKITDREHHMTTSTYDKINRPTTITDALGDVAAYTYDGVGNLARLQITDVVDGKVEPTTYAYDKLNRTIQETYPDGTRRLFAYDAVNLIQRTDEKGQVTHYTYSDLDFLVQRTYPFSPPDTMTYDLAGRLLTAERGGQLVGVNYDGASRVVQTTQNSQTVRYLYDIPGRKRTLTYPGSRTITEHYDARGRLQTIEDGASSPPIATYSYDLGNRVATRDYGNGATASYNYNANNWITDLAHTQGARLIAGFGHAFDNEGNMRFEHKLPDAAHSDTRSEAYQYDEIYRLVDYKVGPLVGSTVPVPTTQTQYLLDGLGNWDEKITDGVTESRTHNLVNEITTIDVTPPGTHESLSYDANGNLTEDGHYRYDYDEENRLTRVTRKLDNRIVGQYRYDAFSRRIAKIADPATPSSPTETRYFYDGTRLIEEQNPAMMTLATYVYGNASDEVLTMERGSGTFYYHQNAPLSVEAMTAATATDAERYSYDAYGLPGVFTGSGTPVPPNAWGTPHSALDNPYLYSGQRFDPETGLYCTEAGYYSPRLGRFINR